MVGAAAVEVASGGADGAVTAGPVRRTLRGSVQAVPRVQLRHERGHRAWLAASRALVGSTRRGTTAGGSPWPSGRTMPCFAPALQLRRSDWPTHRACPFTAWRHTRLTEAIACAHGSRWGLSVAHHRSPTALDLDRSGGALHRHCRVATASARAVRAG